jgi:hypothetical protein
VSAKKAEHASIMYQRIHKRPIEPKDVVPDQPPTHQPSARRRVDARPPVKLASSHTAKHLPHFQASKSHHAPDSHLTRKMWVEVLNLLNPPTIT